MSKKIFVGIGILAMIAVVGLSVLSAEYSKADFVQMLENTEQCLTDCYTVYNVCNPTSQDYSISDSSKFYVDFVGHTNSLTGYSFQKEYNYNVTHIDAVCEEVKCVQLEEPIVDESGVLQTEICTCTNTNSIESQETKTAYQVFTPTAEIIKTGECYTIKVAGNKVGKLGSNNIDNILNYAGYNFTEYAWWNSSWHYSKLFTVSPNYTFSDFPFPLEFDSETLISANKLEGDCSDLRFLSENNLTEYRYEIENRTCNRNETLIWVSINATANNEVKGYMYYGNDNASDVSGNPNLWDNDHVLVLHFGENMLGANLTFDSSVQENHCNNWGATFTDFGVIGGAQMYDGVDDYIDCGNKFNYAVNFTIEAWIKRTAIDSYAVIFSNYYATNGYVLILWGGEDANKNKLGFWSNGWVYSADAIIDTSAWHYVVVTVNSTGDVRFYIDGKISGTPKSTNGINTTNPWTARIGRQGQGTNFFNGTIDEVRISNITRSANWINQTYHYPYADFGSEQGVPAASYLTEAEAMEEILAGIYNSSASTAIIYADQQIYARNITNGQVLGTFDQVAVYLNQTWAFNYISGSDTPVNMFNLTPVLYTLELTNKTEAQIRSEVEMFINNTI